VSFLADGVAQKALQRAPQTVTAATTTALWQRHYARSSADFSAGFGGADGGGGEGVDAHTPTYHYSKMHVGDSGQQRPELDVHQHAAKTASGWPGPSANVKTSNPVLMANRRGAGAAAPLKPHGLKGQRMIGRSVLEGRSVGGSMSGGDAGESKLKMMLQNRLRDACKP